MGFIKVEKNLVNNKNVFWGILKHLKDYALCHVSKKAVFKGCIVRNKGKENCIIIEEGAEVRQCSFCINGNNNIIHIKKNSVINGCVFYIDDNSNIIQIGEGTTFAGKTELVASESTKLIIGNDCMFSYGIVIRTGDHHSILDDEGNRCNLSDDILIGNHVWVAQNVFVLKGAKIENGCVVGACSVVTKCLVEKKSILAGNPARMIRKNISWERERIL